MKADFYSTKKRINSFIRPDEDENSTHTLFDSVFFKESDISMSNPVIYMAVGNFAESNYVILTDYTDANGGGLIYRPKKMYYWITDIVADHLNRWYYHLKIDVLATYKEFILGHAAFIERSTSNYNTLLKDMELPTETAPEIVTETASRELYTQDLVYGSYIFTALSKFGGSAGLPYFIRPYLLNASQMFGIGSALMTSDTLELFKQEFNDVTSAIKGLRFSPFDIRKLTTDSYDNPAGGYVNIGSYSTPILSYSIKNGGILTETFVINIPKEYDDYRGFEYAEYTMSLPFIGLVKLAPEDLRTKNKYTTCTVTYIYDIQDGSITFVVMNGAGRKIAVYSGMADVELPAGALLQGSAIAAQKQMITGIGLSGVAIAGLALGSIPMAVGAAGGVATTMLNTQIDSRKQTATMIGGISGRTAIVQENKIRLILTQYATSHDPALVASLIGRPCGAIHVLSALTGYCKTKNFKMKNSGYMTLLEQKQVEDMFNYEGVFITEGA